MGSDDYSSRHDQDGSAIIDSSKPGRLRAALVVGLLVIAAAAAMWYLQKSPVLGWDFKNNIWFPARLLVSGQSPYRVDLLTELGNAVWMPPLIGVSFPLGWASFATASNLWFLLNLAALSTIIAVLAVKWRPSVALLAIVAVMVAAFPPTLTHLRLGQFTILATMLFLVVAFWKDRLPLPIAALMLTLALSKPQLGVLVVPGLLVNYYREDGRKKALQLVGLLCLWAIVLALPLFFGSANWAEDFVAALRKNPSWAHPSMWLLMPRWFGQIGLWLWILIVVALGVVSLRLWLTRRREDAILWSLALTPLVTPYVWSWDFVMVLPLFASFTLEAKNRLQATILVLGYLVCWFLVWQILTSDPNNVRYWWMPWYMIFLSLGARFAGEMVGKRDAKGLLR